MAHRLERDRLEQRIRRIERVTAALRDRAVYRHAVMGTTPLPLRHAIGEFEVELAGMRRRLSELGRGDLEARARPATPPVRATCC